MTSLVLFVLFSNFWHSLFLSSLQLKLQGEKTGRKGHLSVATEVCLLLSLFRAALQSLHKTVVGKTSVNCEHCSLSIWRKINFLQQIFEVAPSLYMVELRKSGGDTLEFHKVQYNVIAVVILVQILPSAIEIFAIYVHIYEMCWA